MTLASGVVVSPSQAAALVLRLLGVSEDAVILLGTDWRIAYLNDAAARVFGQAVDRIVGRPVQEVYPGFDETPFAELLRLAMATGEVQTRRQFQAPSGKCYDFSAVPADGGIAVQFRDVTDRRHAEGALRTSEERFRMLAESAPIGVLLCDAAGLVVYANPYVREIVGRSEADLRGDRWVRWVHPEDAPRVREGWAAFSRGHNALLLQEFRFVRSTGEVRWVRSRVARLLAAERAPVGYVGTMEDVSVARSAVERQRVLAATIEASADLVGLADPSGRVIFINAAGLRLIGVDAIGSLGAVELHDLVASTEDPRWTGEVVSSLAASGRWIGELQLDQRLTGAPIPTESNVFVVRDGREGPLLATAIVARDITVRSRLEAQLRQAQKVEAVGQLAGGLAHDFNNLLTVIKTYSELAIDQVGPESPLRSDLVEISHAATRAAALTRQLLAFSRKQLLQPRVLPLCGVVTELEPMLRRLIGEDIEIVTALDASTGFVRADPGQLEQVVVNLVVNARDAMPHGGTLTIACSSVETKLGADAPHPGIGPGTYSVMTVQDTGVGMDTATQKSAFEPFFTTKEAGRGTGLGLPTVAGIVQQAGGVVWVESAPGRGTCFTMYLPSVANEPVPPDEAPAGEDATGGTEVVLVAEDDLWVRTLIRSVLETHGYTVIEAADGAEAVRIADGHPIDLLVADVVMPVFGGRVVLERLRAKRPGLHVLYVSGYVDDDVIRRGGLTADAALLHKPFTAGALLAAVRRALRGREEPVSVPAGGA